MCNDDRLVNSCIISGVIIFLVLSAGSIFILLFPGSHNNIKLKNEPNIMGVISIVILSSAFSIIVFILFHRYCLEPFRPIPVNELSEIIVEGNSSL